MSLRNRITLVLYIISITISVFIFASFMSSRTLSAEYTSYSMGVNSGDRIYYAENLGGKGRIFSLADSGRVRNIFSSSKVDEDRVEAIYATADSVYAVLSTLELPEEDAEDDTVRTMYRVVCLNRSLKLQSKTERFTFDETMYLSGFAAESGGLFLTYLSPDGSNIRVFSINPNELKAEGEEPGGTVHMENIRSRKATNDRFFAQAAYHDGDLEVRTDADAPSGSFALDPVVMAVVGKMHMSTFKLFSLYYVYIIWYAAILLIWCVVLFLLIRLFTNRNRMFYYVAVTEAVLLVVTGWGVGTVATRNSEAVANEHARFAVLTLNSLADAIDLDSDSGFGTSDFYFTDRYQGIRSELTGFVNRAGNSEIFYDVMIVRLDDSTVIASAGGRNRQLITDLFGEEVADIDQDIFRGAFFSTADITIDSQNYLAVAVPDGGTVPDYMLLAIINNTTDSASRWRNNSVVFFMFILTFIIGTLLTLAIWYLQNRDLLLLESALRDTAYGRELPERPVVVGGDLRDMWDSIAEINKRVEELQYSKFQILEAYYRFAPKNIEKVLNKNSIIEVVNGDHIILNGSIATINAIPERGGRLERYDRIIGRIGQYQREHGCILIGKAPDMTRIQLMLMEYENMSVEFITDLFNTYYQGDDRIRLSASVFYDRCRFGVTGTDEETTIYTDADHKQLINNINIIISELRLSVVITEDIRDREQVKGPLRFIGYVGYGSGEDPIRLYEVLDAYPARIRATRIATLEKFNEALSSFYEKDFYISRTLFSDILKEIPDDDLVKWYVFESDRYLNENVDEETFRNLHI